MSRKLKNQKQVKNILYLVKPDELEVLKDYSLVARDLNSIFRENEKTVLIVTDNHFVLHILTLQSKNGKWNLNYRVETRVIENIIFQKEDIFFENNNICCNFSISKFLLDLLIVWIKLISLKNILRQIKISGKGIGYEAYSSVYQLDYEELRKKVYFSFVDSCSFKKIQKLPEFQIDYHTLMVIREKVEDKWVEEWDFYLPFEELKVLFEDEKLLYIKKEDENVYFLLYNRNNGYPIFAMRYFVGNENEQGWFEMMHFPESKKYTNKIDEYKEYCANLIYEMKRLFYFYFHYSVNIEVERVDKQLEEKKEVVKNRQNGKGKKSRTQIVPKNRYIFLESEVKKARKRKKPMYVTSSWVRQGYFRNYRDKDGNIIKKVFIKGQICKRKETLLQNENSNIEKRKYKFDQKKVEEATSN